MQQAVSTCSSAARAPSFRIEQAATITDRLRRRGYPIGPYQVTGRMGALGYAVRPIVAGQQLTLPMRPLEPAYVPALFELNDLQTDAGSGLNGRWQDRIFESILVGFSDWCVLETFRNYSGETAAVLVTLQAMAQQLTQTELRTTDAVHGDFSGANILVEDGRVVAVIDWEGAEPGDRAFDLATLLFYDYLNPPVREMIAERLGEITSRQAVSLYLAHMIIRQVEWSISHHARDVIEHYLRIAGAIVRDLAA